MVISRRGLMLRVVAVALSAVIVFAGCTASSGTVSTARETNKVYDNYEYCTPDFSGSSVDRMVFEGDEIFFSGTDGERTAYSQDLIDKIIGKIQDSTYTELNTDRIPGKKNITLAFSSRNNPDGDSGKIITITDKNYLTVKVGINTTRYYRCESSLYNAVLNLINDNGLYGVDYIDLNDIMSSLIKGEWQVIAADSTGSRINITEYISDIKVAFMIQEMFMDDSMAGGFSWSYAAPPVNLPQSRAKWTIDIEDRYHIELFTDPSMASISDFYGNPVCWYYTPDICDKLYEVTGPIKNANKVVMNSLITKLELGKIPADAAAVIIKDPSEELIEKVKDNTTLSLSNEDSMLLIPVYTGSKLQVMRVKAEEDIPFYTVSEKMYETVCGDGYSLVVNAKRSDTEPLVALKLYGDSFCANYYFTQEGSKASEVLLDSVYGSDGIKEESEPQEDDPIQESSDSEPEYPEPDELEYILFNGSKMEKPYR